MVEVVTQERSKCSHSKIRETEPCLATDAGGHLIETIMVIILCPRCGDVGQELQQPDVVRFSAMVPVF